jgi:CheY-like chemotaxis protein
MLENQAYQEFETTDPERVHLRVLPERRKKIMVIDDDQDFRLSVCEMLVDQGYSVMTAKDGETGLNNLLHHAERPDLILVDLMMPVKSGLEFRREQLRIAELAGIPVMFMTGHGIVDGESCLMKPFDERELLEAVRRHVV